MGVAKNKGADKLPSYCEADLQLCFSYDITKQKKW